MSSTEASPAEGDLASALHSGDGFQLLIRTIPDAVLAVDGGGVVRYASALAETYLGQPLASIVGAPFLDLFAASDRSAFPRDLSDGALGAWDVRAARGDAWLNVAILTPDVSTVGPELSRALDGVTLCLVRDVPQGVDLLRDRTDLFRRALDSADNMIVISDPQAQDSPLVFANQHFCDATGYSREEVIGRNCRFLQYRLDGTRDDDQDGLGELRRALAAGENAHVTLRNYRKDGELFYNELFVTAIRDVSGEVVNYVGVQNDVTERVLAARDAASQTGLLRAFYDSAPVLMGVVQRDRTGVIHRTANARAAKLFGMSPRAVAGRRSRELGFSETEVARWERAIEACAEGAEPVSFETTVPWDSLLDADDARALNVTVSRVRTPEGLHQDRLFSYIGEDVTEARQSAARIRTLAAAVEGTAETILITDASPELRILYVNPAHQALTGYTRDEVVGQTPRMFQGPETDRAALARIRRAVEAGETAAAETVNYRKDGTPYLLHWDVSPIRDETGATVKWVSLQLDVTDQRRLEFEVLEAAGREQEWMARELHDGLGQVLTGSAIQLHVLAQELEARGDASLAGDALRIKTYVLDALEQARTISRGLFPVAIEAGELAPALRDLCQDAGGSLGLDIRFESRGSIEVASAERAGHLYRIVQEALTNAARHAQAQRVRVTLTREGLEGTLTVLDDGRGIADAALESGGGLGLRTMAYRARRVGGMVTVGRGEQAGTLVRARFPLVAAEAGQAAG